MFTISEIRTKSKLPVKALALGKTEELLISKAKKRPCLVVACDNTSYTDKTVAAELHGRRHLQDSSMILAPIYGIASPENETGFPPVMVARIRALLYTQFFFVPKTCPTTGIALAKEGIIRLDRLFPASPNRGISPMNIKLAEEPLDLLMAMLRARFGAPPSDSLRAVQEILYEVLPDDCRPPLIN
ncbi:MAG: hypothetical protein ACYDEV_09405 [Acidiferrobacter sp.]